MALYFERTAEEALVSAPVVRCLAKAAAQGGRAVLLVPSFAQALDAQRVLAGSGALCLGVTVSTPYAWAKERWEVWGDGRRLVDEVSRLFLCSSVCNVASVIQQSPLKTAHLTPRVLAELVQLRPIPKSSKLPGNSCVLADLAKSGLPWLTRGTVPAELTSAERELVSLLGVYEAVLHNRGLVEPGVVLTDLPSVLRASRASVPPVVVAGHTTMSASERALVKGLAELTDVTLVLPAGEGPLSVEADELLALLGLDHTKKCTSVAASPTSERLSRAPELNDLITTLFRPAQVPIVPTGSVRLALSAGPFAEDETISAEVSALAASGAQSVVLVAHDPYASWTALSPRLAARNVTARLDARVGLSTLECGRAFLDFVRTVAKLAALSLEWPDPIEEKGVVRVSLGSDMTWWPPLAMSDFLVSEISNVGPSKARRLDASWRKNRLLTPPALLEELLLEGTTSKEVAGATRELLRGRVGAAASKLFAPYVHGNKTTSPIAPEAQAVLSAVLGLSQTIRDLKIASDGAEPNDVQGSVRPDNIRLVLFAVSVLEQASVQLRLERCVPGATCVATIMSAQTARCLAPCSADALVLLGQTTVEEPVSAADDAQTAILAAAGIEPRPNALLAARSRLASLVAVSSSTLVLERMLFGFDGKLCYPSVMAGEVLTCYGVGPDDGLGRLIEVMGPLNVTLRSETNVSENSSNRGIAAKHVLSEAPSRAGVMRQELRDCVIPPPDGMVSALSQPLLSASQIETYLECPYKWFSLRRLRLSDVDAGFTGAEVGTFAHRVLEVTHRDLLARSVERLLKSSVLADIRATQGPGATQLDSYRAEVKRLLDLVSRDPVRRIPGSSLFSEEARKEAREVLIEEFDEHLAHQYQYVRGHKTQDQALVYHNATQEGTLDQVRRDLLSLIDYESGALRGFEPRFFEWKFGGQGEEVSYAGALITGTVDRIDVNERGEAIVIDYKHKADYGFAAEYDLFGAKGAETGEFVAPRHVQSLIYAQIVSRLVPDLSVRGAVYLCTKGDHAIAGAIEQGHLGAVFGSHVPSDARIRRLLVPRAATFGQAFGTRGLAALLDACEDFVATRIERMVAGDVEANPAYKDSCRYCPVLNCERRQAET